MSATAFFLRSLRPALLGVGAAALLAGGAAQARQPRKASRAGGFERVVFAPPAAVPDASAQQCYGPAQWTSYVFRCAVRPTPRAHAHSRVKQYPFGLLREDYKPWGMPGVSARDYLARGR